MGSKHIKRRVLNYEKPWIRKSPKPPKVRTLMGESFSAANYQGILKLQHCEECDSVNYPPRERCFNCLSDELIWRETDPDGVILSTTELHHSQWEYFKRKIGQQPWAMASVLLAGQKLFVHLAMHTFEGGNEYKSLAELLPKGTSVKVFTQSDVTYKSVLIAVSANKQMDTVAQRVRIVEKMGLR